MKQVEAPGGGGGGRRPGGDNNEERKKHKNNNVSLGGYTVDGDSFDEEFVLQPEKAQHRLGCVKRLLAGNPAPSSPEQETGVKLRVSGLKWIRERSSRLT
ncbi:hypothetical protein C8A01DRAFT_32654 [Parachaetomium inaequale]|uniref:Uncharacterized protein n=1 Tax=Parachaetomium inaequale TaxID=2588326 RepID=A0AAN6PRK9_9PEZI|nr:hypothetical protein C8A01DRAFT_32654 [Parachaetomium inaequale]